MGVIWNVVDFAFFLSLPIAILFIARLPALLKKSYLVLSWRLSAAWVPLLLSVLSVFIALDLTGISRGEVSRIWAYFGPLFVLLALAPIKTIWPLKRSGLLVLIGLIGLQVFSMNTRWDTYPSFMNEPPPRVANFVTPEPEVETNVGFGRHIKLVGIALLFKFTGPLALGSRIISASMGTLAVLATYWLAWELPADDRRRHVAAIIAAIVYSIMLTAIATARSGWHSPSFALLAMVCLAALVRARRLGSRRWFIIAGALAGLAQYTYPTARLLPVWLIVIALYDLTVQRERRRTRLAHYALAALIAAIVFFPLGIFFIQNPQWLFERAQQTSSAINLGQNILKTLLGFVVQGSTENLHNLPGRPLLDPVLGFSSSSVLA